MNDTCAQRIASGIKTARHHGGAHGKARDTRRRLGDCAHHLVRGIKGRQQLLAYARIAAKRGIVRAAREIKAAKTVGKRGILRELSRQAQHRKGIGLQKGDRLFVNLWHIALVPDDFGEGEARLQRVARGTHKALDAKPFVQLVADIRRAGIHPDGGGGKHLAVFIHGNRRPALSVNADARDLLGGYLGGGQQQAHGAADRRPPVVRLLLDKPRGGVIDRIFCRGHTDRAVAARLVKKRGLYGRGADINAK